MKFEFREIGHESPEYRDACVLRDALLRAPLGMDLFAEDLAAEATYYHFAGFDAHGQLVAYLHFKPLGGGVFKMQQVAVATRLHGVGIGRSLVDVAEEGVRERGCVEITLAAREEVTEFYTALGYECVGERFEEIGIPHFMMRKRLRS
jgi:predicted GNAT family N-acyltransferase